jgi:hypothetical protein
VGWPPADGRRVGRGCGGFYLTGPWAPTLRVLARLGLTVAGDPLWFDELDDERQTAVIGLLVAEGRAAGQAPSRAPAPAAASGSGPGPGPAPSGVDAEAWGRLSTFWEP